MIGDDEGEEGSQEDNYISIESEEEEDEDENNVEEVKVCSHQNQYNQLEELINDQAVRHYTLYNIRLI